MVHICVGSTWLIMSLLHPAYNPHSNVIGFLFPAYYSFKAIESSNKEDDKQWYVSLRRREGEMGERVELQGEEQGKSAGD